MNKVISYFCAALMIFTPMLAVAQETKSAATPTTAAKVDTVKTEVAKVDTAKVEAKSDTKLDNNFVAPKHKCAQPAALDKVSSDTQQKNFVKEVDAYRDCLIAFRNDMNKLAKANVDAGNAAVEEFNAYVASLNKK